MRELPFALLDTPGMVVGAGVGCTAEALWVAEEASLTATLPVAAGVAAGVSTGVAEIVTALSPREVVVVAAGCWILKETSFLRTQGSVMGEL